MPKATGSERTRIIERATNHERTASWERLSFAELAFEVRQVAAHADYLSDEGDELVSLFPLGIYRGIEHALADMKERARRIRAAADLLLRLSAIENVVCQMLEKHDATAERGANGIVADDISEQLCRDFEAIEAPPFPSALAAANDGEAPVVDSDGPPVLDDAAGHHRGVRAAGG